jgi:hypothetical protein
MAKTKVEDIFVPEKWELYFIERTAELANFGSAGLVERNAEFDGLAARGGSTVEMPFWTDLTGEREIISDTNALTPAKIVASKDVARIHNDAKAWSTTMLAELLAGDDPMEAIVQLVGEYWARIDEDILVSTIKGVFAEFDSISGDPNLLKIGVETIGNTDADSILTGQTFFDAQQKLGDMKTRLTAIAVHSATESDLKKQDEIEFIPDSEGSALLPTFKGLRVIMDDDLPSRNGTTSGTVYTSVLFGQGAIARGFANLNVPLRGGFGTQAVELSRVTLNHDDVLVNRRRHIMHPRGVKWVEGSVAAAGGPTNTELEDAANWEKVFEAKNIRIVGIEHNLFGQIPASS